ncbi:acyltransferase [Undibacterium sp.]|jgi:peptidoglycan/LPS O-acetylase OafA/YrhL|uniref:acyltransferase family protein n=1 Tax=Undibacterium sp. TaxID=1914977 RepID=UPI002C6F4B79|nr:acyltransferase [Undibacterium sp.]HTD03593.1 acyltransferase [Undibacterium sp.]
MSVQNPLPQNVQHADRIQFLDGLRGVAILMVILFHAYVRWAGLYPYGSQFADVPMFAYGMLGVQLFFIISGFVILMTLEKCATFLSFMLKRWLRLFPAMLICSLFIFLTASFFWERPAGPPIFRDMLPGLSFVEPYVWGKVLGSPQGALEGAFWSLYVEVKFYVLFGLLYFTLGGRKAILALTLLFFASALISLMPQMGMSIPQRLLSLAATLLYWSGAEYYGWFAAGALYFWSYQKKNGVSLVLAVAIACIAATVRGTGIADTVAALVIVLIFTAAIVSQQAQRMFRMSVLAWIGLISYPLYLLHENLMVAMIIKIGKFAPWMPSVLMPVLPVVIVIALAALVAQVAEPWLRQVLRAGMARIAPRSRTVP